MIRKFNESLLIDIYTIVRFENGEYVTALYINHKLIKYGDEYHNKMSDYIRGYIEGVKSCKEIEVEKRMCEDEEMNERICDGDSPPKELDEIFNK